MNIPLNDGYRLSADKYQWIVQKKRKKLDKEGNIVWRPLSFHPTPEHAIKHHAHMLVRTSEAETLQEALNQIERVTSELTQALSGEFDVTYTTK